MKRTLRIAWNRLTGKTRKQLRVALSMQILHCQHPEEKQYEKAMNEAFRYYQALAHGRL